MENPTTGQEIFGTSLPPDWEPFDLYSQTDADFTRMGLQDGWIKREDFDISPAMIEELRKQREHDPKAKARLELLASYRNVYRYLHAMNVRDDPTECLD